MTVDEINQIRAIFQGNKFDHDCEGKHRNGNDFYEIGETGSPLGDTRTYRCEHCKMEVTIYS